MTTAGYNDDVPSVTTADDLSVLRSTRLLDPEWYQNTYPDVRLAGVDPAEHYLLVGALLGRNPGPGFDTRFYIETNGDVSEAGMNPLVHYVKYGRAEGRAPKPQFSEPGIGCRKGPPADGGPSEEIDVVIPVYNALDDVRQCLESIRAIRDGFAVRAIVVNDGSDAATTAWLRSFCGMHASFELIEHPSNRGYTCAINTGLRSSTAELVICLNSDTIVARGWLQGMVGCMRSEAAIGIVGPLSNAASWQSVPRLFDDDGAFAINALDHEMSPDSVGAIVAAVSSKVYPRVPFVNGFCFMIRRAVIDAIGYMDEQAFPVGYGEENDYCVRAADAGFCLAIADDAYVYHAKSKSFGHERRKELCDAGSRALNAKHSAEKINRLVARLRDDRALDGVRSRIVSAMSGAHQKQSEVDIHSLRILFVLPVPPGSGGTHSVVQEATEMRRLGVDVTVAVQPCDIEAYHATYGDMPLTRDVFIAADEAGIVTLASAFNVVVATIAFSVRYVQAVVAAHPHIMPAYYVQDYEPLFASAGTEARRDAYESYRAVPNAVVFAKTRWLARKVTQEHQIVVHKVVPSLDHGVYFPKRRKESEKIGLAAMIRPQTPYRGAERTMLLFSRLAKSFPDAFEFHLFGCSATDPQFSSLRRDFAFVNHGVLLRAGVADVLRHADIFVDLSDYQAFGRTALEAMACGCAAIVPATGGADEYAVDGVNSFVVDTADKEAAFRRIVSLLHDRQRLRRMQQDALLTASRYTVTQAAVSELALLCRSMKEFVAAGDGGAHRSLDAPGPSLGLIDLAILFLMPLGGCGGGIHSVVQEAAAMRRAGVDARVAIRRQNQSEFFRNYADIGALDELFVVYDDFDSLAGEVRDFDVVIATIYSSLRLLKRLRERQPHFLPAYYIQDYEPLFFPTGSEDHALAISSYTEIPDAVCFAKTQWIIDEVFRRHGVRVHKVSPSIDHDVYRPAVKRNKGRITIVAMIRPDTPRRGAERTMRVLARLNAQLPKQLTIKIFGCQSEDEAFRALEREFPYRNLGVLTRPEVASVLREADLFIDLSDYQAFGRTALEAMACGAASIVPKHGGIDEFAVDGVNSLVVDPFDEEDAFRRIAMLLSDRPKLFRMQQEAIRTAAKFSTRDAALSELELFSRQGAYRGVVKSPTRRKRVIVLPSLMGNGRPAGSGYVRLIHPYASKHLADYTFDVRCTHTLPAPGAADFIIVQREMGGISLDEYVAWAHDWRAAGSRIIYDVDDDMLDERAIMMRTGRTEQQASELGDRIRTIASLADIVTVSMPTLAAVMSRYNPHVRVIDNRLDEATWWISTDRPTGPDVYVKKPSDPVRIGYIGTPTHDQDLALFEAAAKKLTGEFGHLIAIEVIGAFEKRPPLFGMKVPLPKVTEYPRFVEWLGKRVNWDIGIIPLVDDNFNRSKSFLKFLEYSALGLAIVCSDVSTYSSVARDEENCLLASNQTDSWYWAVRRLILDASLRKRLAEQARHDLIAGYTIQRQRDDYERVLSDASS